MTVADISVPTLVKMFTRPCAAPRRSSGASSMAMVRSAPPTTTPTPRPTGTVAAMKPQRPKPGQAEAP